MAGPGQTSAAGGPVCKDLRHCYPLGKQWLSVGKEPLSRVLNSREGVIMTERKGRKENGYSG